MTKRNCSFVLVGVLLCCAALRAAADDCIYTAANIDKDRYLRNREFRSVRWEDETNTAHVVTRSGESLTIRHWACEHLSVEGKFSIRVEPSASLKYFRDKALWLGKQLLEPEDVAVLERVLDGSEFRRWQPRSRLKLKMDGRYYSWMSLGISVDGSTAVITLFGSL